VQRPRRTAWTAPLVGGVGVAWAAALMLLPGSTAVQHVSNLGLLAVALAAGAAGVLRSRRTEGDKARRFWLLLGTGVLFWAGGQLAWTWYESVLGIEVPFPSLADVGYLGLPPLAAAALFSLPLAAPTVAGRIRTLLDGLVVATSVLLCSWLLVLGPAFRADAESTPSQMISLAYPLGDVALITIVIYTWSRARHLRETLPVSLPLVASGLLAFAVADSGFTYLNAVSDYSSGSVIDLGWFTGFALLFLAAVRVPATTVDEGDVGVGSAAAGNLLPYAAVAVALATSVLEFMRAGFGGEFTFWVRTTLMALLVLRQVLTLRENLALTRDLEARVDARTAELRTSQQRFSALVQHSSDLVTVVDADGAVSYQSESSQRVLGLPAHALVGRSVLELMEDGDARAFVEAMRSAPADRSRVHTVRSAWLHASGRVCQVEVTITNLLGDPHVGGLVLNTRDVTDRVLLEQQLTHQAFTDSLTALPNRALFKDRLQHALARRGDGGSAPTVFFLDLDGFKAVNDTLGHGAGDTLLVEVARRLRAVVRPSDTVARFGGDEFAVLLEEVTGDDDVLALAERIVQRLEEPVVLHGEAVHVGASIGIATRDADAVDAEGLLRNADLAMYQAKAARTGRYAVYHPGMHAGLVDRVRLEGDLRRAVAEQQLHLHYQPMVDIGTGMITGVEALLRWRHPERGTIPPNDFIPLAESTGLIREIGQWVLREACSQAVRWSDTLPGAAGLKMSVNVSGQQVGQSDLVARVAEVLAETGLPARRLTLEMTESVLIDNTTATLDTLSGLRDLGVGLAIDDFGTGYSSLSYLHRFPVDTLKIDRSFVERLSRDGDATFIETIVGLAQSLRMETVAEGVEELHQLVLLQSQGCTTAQGYHFSPPVEAEAFAALLARQALAGPEARGMPRQGARRPAVVETAS
jgi:diguanylate cyclase (GGDEF)-like protein/PAS domain S-box-containing protein